MRNRLLLDASKEDLMPKHPKRFRDPIFGFKTRDAALDWIEKDLASHRPRRRRKLTG